MTYRTDCLGESNGNEIAIYISVTVSGIDRSGARGPRATKVNIDVGRVQQSTPQPFKERGPGTVSYTHLDVYKRQIIHWSASKAINCDGSRILTKREAFTAALSFSWNKGSLEQES